MHNPTRITVPTPTLTHTPNYLAQFRKLPDLGGRSTWPAAFERCDNPRSFSILLGRVYFELESRVKRAVADRDTAEADRLCAIGDAWIERVCVLRLSKNWRHWRFALNVARHPERGGLRENWGECMDFVYGPYQT